MSTTLEGLGSYGKKVENLEDKIERFEKEKGEELGLGMKELLKMAKWMDIAEKLPRGRVEGLKEIRKSASGSMRKKTLQGIEYRGRRTYLEVGAGGSSISKGPTVSYVMNGKALESVLGDRVRLEVDTYVPKTYSIKNYADIRRNLVEKFPKGTEISKKQNSVGLSIPVEIRKTKDVELFRNFMDTVREFDKKVKE